MRASLTIFASEVSRGGVGVFIDRLQTRSGAHYELNFKNTSQQTSVLSVGSFAFES